MISAIYQSLPPSAFGAAAWTSVAGLLLGQPDRGPPMRPGDSGTGARCQFEVDRVPMETEKTPHSQKLPRARIWNPRPPQPFQARWAQVG
jgi:hypothetical protein